MPRTRLPKCGSFVALRGHPEYGVGRVVAIGPFTLRVVFMYGGLHVIRAQDAQTLVQQAPALGDIAVLLELEAGLADLFDPATHPRRPANDDVVVQER